MSSVPVLVRHTSPNSNTIPNPLPPLLRTPAGLALLEVQGTLHFPRAESDDGNAISSLDCTTPIGHLVFDGYNPDAPDANQSKQVYMYVGKHQKLCGEIKKLANALGVVRRIGDDHAGERALNGTSVKEELEIIDIVRWKIVFSARPEPVGG